MNKLCCIVAAGPVRKNELSVPSGAFLIAADAGLRPLRALGITPDLIVGDFDSLGERPAGGNVVYHQPEKDDTDTMLAVREGLARGYDRFLMYGALGGRLDHTLANLQTLAFLCEHGARGYLVGEGIAATAFRNGGISFRGGLRGTVSVFTLGADAEGVYERGLRYPLSDYTMSAAFPIGVSNEFTGAPAEISVRSGTLLVLWNADAINFEDFAEKQ